jgi:broad specificity phosphatase PhoE
MNNTTFVKRQTLIILVSTFLLLLLSSSKSLAADIYLVRHFEKQSQTTSLDVPNNQRPDKGPSLTEVGLNKAERLASFLEDKQIRFIYSTDYTRTRQSALPSSVRLDVPIILYSPKDLNSFANELRALDGNALVLGHSNTTPQLLALLGGPEKKLEEKDYGDLFIITQDGERFRHVVIEE